MWRKGRDYDHVGYSSLLGSTLAWARGQMDSKPTKVQARRRKLRERRDGKFNDAPWENR